MVALAAAASNISSWAGESKSKIILAKSETASASIKQEG